MPHGREVDLGPSNIVLDGDPASLPKKGAEPPVFGPCLLWPNGWIDQDGTWHGGGPRSRPHCARLGPSSPPQKGGRAPPQFLAHVYCGQTAGWIKMALGMEVGPDPGHIVLDGDPAPPTKKAQPPVLDPRLLWPKGLVDQYTTWYRGRPEPMPYCVRWGPSSS